MTSILKVDNIQNSSGTSAISIDSNGRLNQGSPVGFSARLESSLTISSNNAILHTWGITTADLYGGFNTDGASGTMLNQSTGIAQVPVTGYYTIICNARIDSFSGTYQYLDIIKTNSSGTYSSASATLIVRSLESDGATDYTELQAQSLAYLQASDYVAVYWANSGDNNVTINADTYFSMFKVG